MKNKFTSKGVITIVSDNPFEPDKKVINPPRKSKRFDTLSLYYNGVYYFPETIKESTERPGLPWEITVCYYEHKWRQSTFYCTDELIQLLKDYSK